MEQKNKEPDFERYKEVYEDIDREYPQFWKWVGVSLLVILFLFALPYLLEHTTKTIRAYKGLRVVIASKAKS